MKLNIDMNKFNRYATLDIIFRGTGELWEDNPKYVVCGTAIRLHEGEAKEACRYLKSVHGDRAYELLAKEKAINLAIAKVDDFLNTIPDIVKEEQKANAEKKEARITAGEKAGEIYKKKIEPSFRALMEATNEINSLGDGAGLTKEFNSMINELIGEAPLSLNDRNYYRR
jgi:hypothetical protein